VTIFFKDCPLCCMWCCNPEGQNPYQELMYFRSLCIGCGVCGNVCPHGAVTLTETVTGIVGRPDASMLPEFNRVVCLGCDEKPCVEACRGGALRKAGESVTAAELFERIKPFEPFFRTSGGGVTLSGGEPLAQPLFAREFLALCNEHNIRCGLETCGCFNWEATSDFITGFDFIYFDVKCTDDKYHQKLTGKSFKTIHANLRKLSRVYSRELIVSVPVIPGINDNEEEISRVAALCLENNIRKVRLLPYHDLARPKYEALGIPYSMEGTASPSEGSMEQLSDILAGYGLCLVSS